MRVKAGTDGMPDWPGTVRPALTDVRQAEAGHVHRTGRKRQACDNVQDSAQKYFPRNLLAGHVAALVPLVVARAHHFAVSGNKPFLLLRIIMTSAIPAAA